MKIVLASFLLLAAPAIAQDVRLESDVLIERTVTGPDGRASTKLEPPSKVVPGDRVVIQLRYNNAGSAPATGFAVTNPIPAAIAFSGTASPGHDVSVDGAKSWGEIATLTVAQADGTSRPATPADVTHIRWILKAPIAPQGTGQLSFGGLVR